MPTISELHIYPIKSCAGISLTEALITEAGLSAHGVCDREWMLVDAAGRFLTQREHPRMALIRPSLSSDGLIVDAPSQPSLTIPLSFPSSEFSVDVQIWDDQFSAFDMGDGAANWFTDFLGTPCRMVRFDRRAERLSSSRWTRELKVPNLFSDGFPFLVISTSSLADLNQKAAAQAHPHYEMQRFRPNIVIDGVEAFEEDYMETFSVGGVVSFAPVKPCPRCPIPSVNPASGEFGASPLNILQTYRANALLEGAITFGMNLMLVSGAGEMLRVGNEVGYQLAF
jgi:uncharacterized protein